MWLFLDLVAAESLVVFMSSIFPNFVVSLALTAFANGLWMSVGGFLVPSNILNVFWKYVFHYIDYQVTYEKSHFSSTYMKLTVSQSYVFQGMMVNKFQDRIYSCSSDCNCMYQTELASQCQISGRGVLDQYGYSARQTGTWVGILLGIV